MRAPGVFLFLLLAGCGYVADPQPPALHIPVAVSDLRAVEYGENLLVAFTAPALTTEALAISRLRGAELRVGPWPAGPDVASWMETARVIPLAVEKPGAVSQAVPLDRSWVGKEVLILARTFGPKGRVSANSNTVFLLVEPPLEKPAGLRAENHPEGVRLSWSGAGAKYRVLRAAGDAAPVAVADVEAREYLDTGSVYGIRYRYRVQALGDKAQSEASEPAEITPVDVFPPAVPSGLSLVVGPSGVDLAWERNAEADFKLYRIYRAAAGGPWERIAEVDTPSYVDRTAESGRRYRYRISSVDQLGNESAPSPAIEVAVPD